MRTTVVLFPSLFPNHFTTDSHSPFRIQQVAKSFYARLRSVEKLEFSSRRTVIDHLTSCRNISLYREILSFSPKFYSLPLSIPRSHPFSLSLSPIFSSTHNIDVQWCYRNRIGLMIWLENGIPPILPTKLLSLHSNKQIVLYRISIKRTPADVYYKNVNERK